MPQSTGGKEALLTAQQIYCRHCDKPITYKRMPCRVASEGKWTEFDLDRYNNPGKLHVCSMTYKRNL